MTSILKYARPLAAALILAALSPSPAVAGSLIEIPFDAGNFSDPLDIDNPYWPLVPGTTFVYYAEGEDECELNVFTVTDLEKPITIGADTIMTRVVEDLAWLDQDCDGTGDVLEERTFDWHAQDDDGNIWYFGEDTRARCEDGTLCNPAGSWEAGIDGAAPGIIMLAAPMTGDRYYQEFYAGEAEDQAKVLRLGAPVTLEFDNELATSDFAGCVKTKEWTALAPGLVEHKYYCPGTGLVLVEELKEKTLIVELIAINVD